MAWFSGAIKRPIVGHTDGPMDAWLGMVLHVNGSNGNLYNWVSGNHNVSCHFEVYKSGVAEQYLDTAVSSWAQMNGNSTYLSLETEGYPGEPLTGPQLSKCAEIVRWAAGVHRFPLQLAEAPGQRGLGWHGMGGVAWGNHPGCPGDLRKAQRSKILELARVPLIEPLEEIMALYDGHVLNATEARTKANFEAAMRAIVIDALKDQPVRVTGLLNYAHDGYPTVEAYFTGVPGYVPVATRA